MIISEPLKLGVVAHLCNPSTQEAGGIWLEASLEYIVSSRPAWAELTVKPCLFKKIKNKKIKQTRIIDRIS